MVSAPYPWYVDPYIKTKGSDEAKTVDTNEDDAQLFFSLPEGSYMFDINLAIAAGTGIKCELVSSVLGFFPSTNYILKKDSGTNTLVHEFNNSTISVANIAADSAFRWWGIFLIADDGTLNFQWSRNTASGTSTVQQGSSMYVHRVS